MYLRGRLLVAVVDGSSVGVCLITGSRIDVCGSRVFVSSGYFLCLPMLAFLLGVDEFKI